MEDVKLKDVTVEDDDKLSDDPYGSKEWVLEKLNARSCVDRGWVAFFSIYLVLFVVVLVMAFTNGSEAKDMRLEEDPSFKEMELHGMYIALGVAVIVSFTWITFLRCCARGTVFLTIFLLFGTIMFGAGVSTYYAWYFTQESESKDGWLAFGWACAAAVFYSALLGLICFSCLFMDKIDRTIEFTEMALKAIFHRPDIFIFMFIMALLVLGYFIMIIFAINACFLWAWYYLFLVIFMAFYFYCVMIAITRATIAGTVCAFYFSKGKNYEGMFPSFKALGRSFISFGALCKGAMVTELAKMAIVMLEYAERQLKLLRSEKDMNSCMKCCGFCCCKCVSCYIHCLCCGISQWVQWVTTYAYVLIALEGVDFKTAGKHSLDVLREHGVQALVNDVFSRWNTIILCWVGTLISVLCNGLHQYNQYLSESDNPVEEFNWLSFMVSGFMAYFLCRIVTLLIDVSLQTLSVCYAFDIEQSKTSGTIFAFGDLKKALKKVQDDDK